MSLHPRQGGDRPAQSAEGLLRPRCCLWNCLLRQVLRRQWAGAADGTGADDAGGFPAVCAAAYRATSSRSSVPAGWSMSSASAHRSRWRGCTSFRHHRHRDEPADRPPTDSLPDVRQRVHRGSFCAAARSLTRKRSITSSFSPAARTLRATSRPCWRARVCAHRTRRNGVNLVYVKSCDNVERIISFMGRRRHRPSSAPRRLSSRCATKSTATQTAIPQTWARRPVPTPRLSKPSAFWKSRGAENVARGAAAGSSPAAGIS